MPSGSEFPRWPIETVAVLVARLNDLPVSSKAANFLGAMDVDYFGDVVLLKESLLFRLFNFDQETIDELSLFLATFDLKFGMDIPGWTKARADQVRKIIEGKLPSDVAIHSLIKTVRAFDPKNNTGELNATAPFLNETAAVSATIHSRDNVDNAEGEQDFTRWPLEALALLVARPNELPLSVRATNCLSNTGHKFFGDVILLKESDLYRFQNLGRKTAQEIHAFVHEFGLHLGMTIPGWSSDKAYEVRKTIVSRLPRNVAITNLIAKDATRKIQLLPPSVTEKTLPNFDALSVEQKTFLVATPVELLLPPRIVNALHAAGHVYLGEIAQLSFEELLKIKNLGRRSANNLLEIFQRSGIELGIEISGWSRETAKTYRKEIGNELKASIGERNTDLFASLLPRSDCLEDELQELLKSITSARNAEIGIDFWGFDGSLPKTLDAVGKKQGITRERVRQITAGITRRVEKSHFSTPLLDQALKFLCENGPGTDAYLADCLKKNGLTKINFSIDGVIAASKIFKLKNPLRRIRLGSAVLYLDNPELNGKEELAIVTLRKHTGSSGCTSVNRIATEIDLNESDTSFLRKLLSFVPEVVWLDDDKEWLSSNRTARNRLTNLVVKVLSVAPELRTSELRRAVARSHRLDFAPPVAVLERFCAAFKLAYAQGELIISLPRLGSIDLSDNEKILVEAFKTKRGARSREDIEDVCIGQHGLNPSSFYIYLSFSPLITRLSRGIYCVVGSTVNPGDVESIERQRRAEAKTPEYGWAADGKLWCAYPLSRITIHSGTMRLPQFVADLVQGEWSIARSGGETAGHLRVTKNFAVGLRKPLNGGGAELDDLCLLMFDMGRRTVEMQLGGPDLIDRLTENILRPEEFTD